MRIALCTDQYLPMLSGAVDSIEALGKQLIQNGHEVRIYAPALPGSTPSKEVFLFPAYSVPGTANAFIVVMPIGAMHDIKKFKPEVIHTHFVGIAGFFAWYASWRLGVPLVGTDHTLPADYLHYIGLDYAPFRWFVRAFSSWFYNRCVFVTAPSKHVLNELKDYGTKRPLTLISNPILTGHFRPLENRVALKHKHNIGGKSVVIFGRLAVEKNLDRAMDIFAEALAFHADAELVFVGDGPYRAVLEERASQTLFAGRVRFLGTLRGEALVEVINACDVYLITSLSDTQSMSMLQAFACGLPVLAARAGGLPEYVHNGVNGYCVDPRNISLFAEKLIELLSEPEKARVMGEAGRQSVMQYSPKAITKQFEEIYQKAIAK